MTVSTRHPVYRSLLHMYPASFRDEYGEDLVQHLADLVRERGPRAAWRRTSLDLICTIPRYRLESIMNEKQSVTAVSVAIVVLATGGVLSLLFDLGSPIPGVALAFVAIALGVAQRSRLARAIRVPDTNRRRRRLVTAAISGVVFIVSYVAFNLLIGDSWTVRETVLTAIGFVAFIAALSFLVIGLATPRSATTSTRTA